MQENILDLLLSQIIKEKKDLSIKNLWELFINHSKVKCRQQTIIRYQKEFKAINNFFEANEIILVSQINENIINDFISYRKSRGCKNITINQNIEVIQWAIAFAIKKKYITENPFHDFKKLPVEHYNGTTTSFNDLKKAFEIIDESYDIKSFPNVKHTTIFYIMIDTGIRPSELVNIRVSNLFLRNNEIKLEYTKAYENRSIFIDNKTKEILLTYLELFRPVNYLFFRTEKNNRHEKMSTRVIMRIFADIKIKADISTDFNAREIRRTFATNLVKCKVNIKSIMDLMGHANIRTTQRYFNIEKSETKSLHNKFTLIKLKS